MCGKLITEKYFNFKTLLIFRIMILLTDRILKIFGNINYLETDCTGSHLVHLPAYLFHTQLINAAER